MKLTIFGASGLVGRNLCDVLNRHYADFFSMIDTPSSTKVNLLVIEEVKDYFSGFRPDVVINLAGKVGGILANKQAGADFYFENILMNAHVYEVGSEYNVKQLISLGAGCGYPLHAPEPLTELRMFDGRPQPESIGYSMAKKMLIVQEEVYRKQHDFLSTVIIPSNIYGKYDNFSLSESHVIPALIRKFYEVKYGISDRVIVWGNGTASRDFIDAYDVGRAIVKCIEKKASGVYNVGYGEQQSIGTITKHLCKISGVSDIHYDETMPSGQNSREFSVAKFANLIPDFECRNIISGLEDTYNWFSDNYRSGEVRL
jgi:GDP-L-fucose synthase